MPEPQPLSSPVSDAGRAGRESRDFGRVLASEGVSNFGSMLSRLAVPWIAALVLGATPLQMGWLLVADVLAGAVGSLWLASLVDRHRKRSVMLACDGLRAALLAGLAALAWAGWLSFALLLLAAAAGGLLTMAFELARSAWMAQRMDHGALPGRNAQLAVAGSLSETAAFALGGWVFQALGAVVALAVDALSYALSALCLRGVAEPAPPAAAPPGQGVRQLWHEMADGLRAVRARASLRALACIEVLLAAAMGLTGATYVIFVVRDVGFGTGPMGMIAATGGLGAIAGAAAAPVLGRWLGAGWAVALGLALVSLGAFCIPLVAAPGWAGAAWLVAHQIVGDGGHSLQDVHSRTLRQTAVPAALLARADAALRGAGLLATLAGALGGGLLADALGARSALLLSAALAAAAAVLAAGSLARLHPPDPRLPPQPPPQPQSHSPGPPGPESPVVV